MRIQHRIKGITTALLLALTAAACGDSMANESDGSGSDVETAARAEAGAGSEDSSELGEVADADEGVFTEPEAEDEMVIGSEEELVLTVPAESAIMLSTDAALSTDDNGEGDVFTMTVTRDVLDSSGRIAIPAGSVASGRVTAAQESPSSDQPALLKLAVESVEVNGRSFSLSGDITEAEIQGDRRDAGGETAAKIVGGAAAGALLGRILGDDSGDALKGAVAGAAAGTAIALSTKGGHAELPAGSFLTYRLSEPLTIH